MGNRCVFLSVVAVVALVLAAPALAGFAAKEVYLPSVGIGKGAGTSFWYTTIWVHNPGSSPVNVQFQFLERDKSNPTPSFVYYETIQGGDTKRYANAMEAIFGITDRRFGAIRVVAADDVVVNGRIYSREQNGDEADSVGQFFAGVPGTFAIGPGEKTTVLGVHQTSPQEQSDFRYNFGFVEVAGGSPLVQVQLLDDAGSVRMTQAYALRPYEPKQYNITDLAPAIDLENAILEVSVLSNSTGKVVVFGSGLANSSNDPSTFEMTFKDDLLASSGGSLTLPYSGSASSNGSLFVVANTGTGPALHGESASSREGVLGISSGTDGVGVFGMADTGTNSVGVKGASTQGAGVWGQSTNSMGVLGSSISGTGVAGRSGDNSLGVYGNAGGLTSGHYPRPAGVLGESRSGIGVVGLSDDDAGVYGSGESSGVIGIATVDGAGVAGAHQATSGEVVGVYGEVGSPDGYAVHGVQHAPIGVAILGEGPNVGVGGRASLAYGMGVAGTNEQTESSGMLGFGPFGVYGAIDSSRGGTAGVHGYTSDGATSGVWGESSSSVTDTVGVYGLHSSSNGIGIGVSGVGMSASGWGGKFENRSGGGALWVGGTGPTLFEIHRSNGSGVSVNRIVAVAGNGSVYSDGSYNCGLASGCFNSGAGADLAERIDVGEEMEPGDVVEIDADDMNRFRRAAKPRSLLVAGVVSSQPAMTMNNNDLTDNDAGERRDERPLLALVGQVPVKATTEAGPIGVGDLLVSSSTPGHAMRCLEPSQCTGAIIGKALEPLESGSGLVNMLVTLQ